MKSICRKVRDQLAAGGPAALSRDVEARRHVETCADCFDFLEGSAAVDESLAALPPVEPPEVSVARLMRRIDADGRPATRSTRWVLTGGAALAAMILVVVFLPRAPLLDELYRDSIAPPPSAVSQPRPAAEPEIPPVVETVPVPATRNREPSEERGLVVPPPATGLWKQDSTGDMHPTSKGFPTVATSPSRKVEYSFGSGAVPAVDEPTPVPPAHPDDSGLSLAPPTPAPPPPVPHEKSNPRKREKGKPGGISVHVVDSEGDPLPGATVSIAHPDGLVKTSTILSDRDGRAGFPVLRPGSGYTVHVAFPGFAPVRQLDLRVSPKRNLEIPIQLSEAIVERVKVTAKRQLIDLESTEVSTTFRSDFSADLPVPGRYYQNVLAMVGGVKDADGGVNPNSIEEIEIVAAGSAVEFGRAQGGFAQVIQKQTLTFAGQDRLAAEARAREFFIARALTEGVRTQPATGYWANTYAPGDRSLLLLEARLASRLPVEYAQFRQRPLRLHEDAREPALLLDDPAGSGLSVETHADRSSLEGPGRVLMQVGLQGSPAAGRRRTAMNLALVLDLRGDVPVDVATSLRALIQAFGRARETGDRFHLVVAGRAGGVAVGPSGFRRGVLTVTLDRLLNDGGIEGAPGLTLLHAVGTAIERVTDGDDLDAPLGSSAVVLITGGEIGESLETLESTVRESAIAGIPFSVIAAGGGVRIAEVDRLVLAGQGHRRLIRRPAEAGQLVDRELSAVGRVVARAVRIQIRLAPGVRLIDLPGSHRLGDAQSEQVRLAEESIDRRVARNLGIEADRGEDDPGIQIVVPSFYAGDSHAVLLDLAVPGPGPIAEVTVRFKDLVQMRNGVAMVDLHLDGGSRPPGPQEHAVLKSFLALRLAQELEIAARQVEAGRGDQAADRIREHASLLHGIRLTLPGLLADPDLERDVVMLQEYAGLLEAGAASIPVLRHHLADSLRYAGLLKLSPRPSRSGSVSPNGGRHG